jgi:cysteine desulfurase family protein (TIGR01976 family)
MRQPELDNARTRGLYPALAHRQLYFDSPGGALPPEVVLRAMTATLRASLTRSGAVFARSRHTALLIEHARHAVADLVGAEADAVVLGPDLPTLLERLARSLARTWRLADEVVLTRLDREANVRPWISAARSVGAQVRFAQIDVETCELPAWQYENLITARTRVVAVTAASGAVGTRPDVPAIAAAAHARGALVVVDAAALAPHAPIDLGELGADVVAISADAFGGPRMAALAAAPGILARIESDWPGGPLERFERDGVPPEQLSGLIASVDHLAQLVPSGARGSGPHGGSTDRRARLVASMEAVERYERRLFDPLIDSLRAIDGVTVVCADESRTRVPVLQLGIAGHSARDVALELSRASISVWDGDSHTPWLMEDLGVDDAPAGGLMSVGLMPYTSAPDIGRLLAAISRIAGSPARD